MKTLGDIKKELANELGFPDWFELEEQYPKAIYRYYDQASKIYAQQVAQDALDRAAESARGIRIQGPDGFCLGYEVDRKHIRETEIIFP